ncbi:BTB/POZ domain-containing protein NPY2-like [Dendrobium catenatum]|nr:BTB/POZ domain-containing protein NPY2-like [Dendrobium catenatum]
MIVTLNAYNVVAVRCAAEYLEMHETIEKGNLIYKIDIFLNSSIFRSWKDSIIVLQTAKSLQPWSEDLKLVSHCIESLASKVSIDPGEVEWSYTYNRKKLPSENGGEIQWNGVRKLQSVPKDWWVEDLCELGMDSYKRVIMAIKTKGRVCGEVIGEALKAYAYKRLPGFNKTTTTHEGDFAMYRVLLETIVWLLPTKRGSVSCSFLLKLFKEASFLDCGENCRKELIKRIGKQLEEASVTDLLIPAPVGESTLYDIDLVLNVMGEFLIHEHGGAQRSSCDSRELEEARNPASVSGNLSITVVKLIDGYLAEAAKDPNLPILKFVELAGMVSGSARPVHDELYRAIDNFLKEHPDLTKSEKKKICRLMDCKKLSPDSCIHALQNDRLPLRVVVQLLYFVQMRQFSARGTSGASEGGSISTAMNTGDECNGETMAVESSGGRNVKGVLMPKRILGKLWSGKVQWGDNSSSDTSESPSSINPDEAKSTLSRNIRYSVS